MFSFPLGKYQGAQLLDPMVEVCLVLGEIAKLSSQVAVPFCISTSSIGEFLLLHTLPAFGVVSGLGFGHSYWSAVASHYYFNLHFPDDILCGTSFYVRTLGF